MYDSKNKLHAVNWLLFGDSPDASSWHSLRHKGRRFRASDTPKRIIMPTYKSLPLFCQLRHASLRALLLVYPRHEWRALVPLTLRFDLEMRWEKSDRGPIVPPRFTMIRIYRYKIQMNDNSFMSNCQVSHFLAACHSDLLILTGNGWQWEFRDSLTGSG